MSGAQCWIGFMNLVAEVPVLSPFGPQGHNTMREDRAKGEYINARDDSEVAEEGLEEL